MKKNNLRKFLPHEQLLAPSLLAANFAILGQEIANAEAAGADAFHIDIMDGHFVPNLSIGPPIVRSIRPITKLPFDVHLMLSKPADYVTQFCDAGADHITIHAEAEGDVESTLTKIRSLGCSSGICIKPGTDATAVLPYLEFVDLILVMTVEPGFGGQKFIEPVLKKIKTIRDWIIEGGYSIHLEVDGGITHDTGPLSLEAGVNMLVAGTSVFRSKNGISGAIGRFKNILRGCK